MREPASGHKLLVAIVHHDDTDAVCDALRGAGVRFTRIASLGGFLGVPNETFFMAVEDDLVSSTLEAIAAVSHARDVEVPLVLLERLKDWKARSVTHGGATVLMIDLAAIIHL